MTTATKSDRHAAGFFDVRNIIAALLGIYGVVLLILGIVNHSGHEIDKADGLNINLWTGIILVVFSACMATWAWQRPIIVPDEVEDEGPNPSFMDAPDEH